MSKVYQCEDSQEGVFTAIYNIYEDRCDKRDVRVSLNEELSLFAENIPVSTDRDKAEKVAGTLRRRFGEQDYWLICLALSAVDERKAQAVFRTVVQGIGGQSSPGHLFDNLADDSVHLAYSLGRTARNEYHHYLGFLRFNELAGNMLYAEFAPKNHLLSFLMPHFADRMPRENFCVYDVKRKLYGIHPAGREWFVMKDGPEELHELSPGEDGYNELFRCFCKWIAIEERKNEQLQKQLLPLRFRKYMTEFAEDI